ncbi:LamG domain-containing protein [Streptomyces sp. NPDC046977]|uniref:LamG domain-containing protein n=1 Tax=Streptomyces sp. NPDC046977 TaxID=3154703 RepID=UPI003409106A
MTDGTEHPDGANAPGQNAWNSPSAPQPPAAPSGYGYPQQHIPYGQQPGFGQPTGYQQPDWQALADAHEAGQRRRHRLRTAAIVLVACVLGVGAGAVVLHYANGTSDAAAPSPSPSPTVSAPVSPSAGADSPTVPGDDHALADKSGQNNLILGPDAGVNKVANGYVIRLRSNSNSFAQSSAQLIDVTKSFSISAWVYNEAPNVSRSAISQGDGISSSLVLGRDASGAARKWVFRVQTADGGADSTTFQVEAAANVNTVNEWALLTGTYDARTKTVALYVNGKPAGSRKVPGIWAGRGPLQLGRARTHGAWGDYWAGVLGHILIWDQALTPAQVADLKDGGAGGDAKPIASWLVG